MRRFDGSVVFLENSNFCSISAMRSSFFWFTFVITFSKAAKRLVPSIEDEEDVAAAALVIV